MTDVLHVSECYSCGLDYATKQEEDDEWRCPTCLAQPKLQFHYSLEHANKVLALVRDALEQEAPEEFEGSIGAWSNCREQGYSLERIDTEVPIDERPMLVFAQQRNSDGVLVVWGTPKDFSFQNHQPTEEVWEKRRMTYSTDLEAARKIVDILLGKA